MKDDEQCMTTVTTATLELGIDIGRLERCLQIDAALSPYRHFCTEWGAQAGGGCRPKCGL